MPGLATTVQDLGPAGLLSSSASRSRAAWTAHALVAANLLVGNDEGAAVLEAVFMGPELRIHRGRHWSRSPARDLPPKVDGVEQREAWTSFLGARRGQVLSFDFLKRGARAISPWPAASTCRVVLGSRSTYALGALGGFKGRKLEAGDELPLGQPAGAGKDGPHACRPRSCAGSRGTADETCACWPGFYWHRITEAAGNGFFATPGRSRRRRTGSATASRAGKPLEFVPREQPFGAGSDPVQHHRCLLSLRLDPGSRRHRADRAASGRGPRRRLFHGRHRHRRRHGPDRPAAAQHAGEFREGRHEGGARGAQKLGRTLLGKLSQRIGIVAGNLL